MNCFLFTLFFVAAPLATASYGSASGGGGGASYLSSASSNGLDELVQAAAGGAQQAGGSITPANAEIPVSPAEVARLSQVQAQLQALNSNPVYRNLKNSDAIAESLAESNLASKIRQGNINIVAPNVVDQGVYRSLLVPSGQNNHQVIATQPLPPIIVNQPALPPTQIGGGPAAVVKAAPVIYKIKPSVIYQQEVINKVPTPLSLNPVYVKVYKPGKKVDAPLVPGVQQSYQAPSYGGSSYSAPTPSYESAPTSSYNEAPASSYSAAPAAPSYGAAPAQSYGAAPASSYGGEASYGAPAQSYGAAPASSYGGEASYGAPAQSYGAASASSYGGEASYGATPSSSSGYGSAPQPSGY